MQFWNKICGFIAIFFICAVSVSAQTNDPSAFKPFFKVEPKFGKLPVTAPEQGDRTPSLRISPFFSVIPMNFYTQHLGVMCKQELAVEKATKIPFRFRLGSVQQCNYLEGKK